jgi:hypothetical protein
MSNNEKIYCGSGIEKFDGNLVETKVCLSDIPKEHIYEYKGKKYINLNVQKKRKTDDYGKTHYVEVNTWKPEKKEPEHKEPETDDFNDVEDLNDDHDGLPF